MRTTTLRDLAGSIITTIKGITPTQRPTDTWSHTPYNEVAGPKIRVFSLDFVDQELDETPGESVYGNGNTWVVEMLVNTSYGGLGFAEDEYLRDTDLRDLWFALDDSCDTGLVGTAGLVSVSPPRWEEAAEADEGSIFGAYVMDVKYLATDGV